MLPCEDAFLGQMLPRCILIGKSCQGANTSRKFNEMISCQDALLGQMLPGCIICSRGNYNIENSIGSLARVHYKGECLQNIHSVHSRRLQDRIHSFLLLSQIQLVSYEYIFCPPNTSRYNVLLPNHSFFKYKCKYICF